MRNGLNIAAMSELIAEIKEKDIEAHLFYKVCSHVNADIQSDIDVLTLGAGSARAARDFSVAMKGKYQTEMPGYMDFALGALGNCVLITFLFGCSSKAIVFDKINAEISVASENGSPALNYAIYVECDGATEDIVAISSMVSRFSPNHRVFQDENNIEFYINGIDGAESFLIDKNSTALQSYTDLQVENTKANLTWLHGTQYLMTLQGQEGDYSLKVDQPKQYVGYDYGPNPQEVLLSSILQEIKVLFSLASHGKIHVSGHVNIKGILGIDAAVEPKMDQIKITITDMDRSLNDIRTAVLDVIGQSVLIPILVNANRIGVSIYRSNQLISKYLSPLESIF